MLLFLPVLKGQTPKAYSCYRRMGAIRGPQFGHRICDVAFDGALGDGQAHCDAFVRKAFSHQRKDLLLPGSQQVGLIDTVFYTRSPIPAVLCIRQHVQRWICSGNHLKASTYYDSFLIGF